MFGAVFWNYSGPVLNGGDGGRGVVTCVTESFWEIFEKIRKKMFQNTTLIVGKKAFPLSFFYIHLLFTVLRVRHGRILITRISRITVVSTY